MPATEALLGAYLNKTGTGLYRVADAAFSLFHKEAGRTMLEGALGHDGLVHAVVPRGNYTYRVRLASDRWASTNLTLNQSYVLTSPVFDEVVGQIDLTTSKPFYVGKSEWVSFNASSILDVDESFIGINGTEHNGTVTGGTLVSLNETVVFGAPGSFPVRVFVRAGEFSRERTAHFYVRELPHLALSMSVNDTDVVYPDRVKVDVAVHNDGGTVVEGVGLALAVPEALSFLSYTYSADEDVTDGSSLSGRLLNLTLGALGGDQWANATLVLQSLFVNETTAVNLTASLAYADGDGDGYSNSSTEPVTVQCPLRYSLAVPMGEPFPASASYSGAGGLRGPLRRAGR